MKDGSNQFHIRMPKKFIGFQQIDVDEDSPLEMFIQGLKTDIRGYLQNSEIKDPNHIIEKTYEYALPEIKKDIKKRSDLIKYILSIVGTEYFITLVSEAKQYIQLQTAFNDIESYMSAPGNNVVPEGTNNKMLSNIIVDVLYYTMHCVATEFIEPTDDDDEDEESHRD